VEKQNLVNGIISRVRQTVADPAATLGVFFGGLTAEVAESYQKPIPRVILSSLLVGAVGMLITGDLNTATRIGVFSTAGTEVVLSLVAHNRSKK